MKNDIDRLMQENQIDAILITGPAERNPFMYYMTGGGLMTHVDLIKPVGKDPILFHSAMERDEAAKTGLATINLSKYSTKALLESAGGDYIKAGALRYNKMFADAGVHAGRVSVYGREELNNKFGVLMALQQVNPDLKLVGEPAGNSIMLQAMATKDEQEIERIRNMGRITTSVVGQVADFLSSQYARNGLLVDSEGRPVTIGDVKRLINVWLMEQGAENPHGTIFAQGRDAGVPHSAGDPEAPLRIGKTIVFDIFPTEPGEGYHYDFTRTWCLGHAGDEAEALYDDVRSTYETVLSSLNTNSPTHLYQEMTCDLFENLGHPTIRQDEATQQGYVHSLGHGLGLHVHEAPWFRGKAYATPQDLLLPGAVMTVEPGLYYPDQEMGCRLEDTIVVREDGTMEILAEYPLDLVIPVRGS